MGGRGTVGVFVSGKTTRGLQRPTKLTPLVLLVSTLQLFST